VCPLTSLKRKVIESREKHLILGGEISKGSWDTHEEKKLYELLEVGTPFKVLGGEEGKLALQRGEEISPWVVRERKEAVERAVKHWRKDKEKQTADALGEKLFVRHGCIIARKTLKLDTRERGKGFRYSVPGREKKGKPKKKPKMKA